ncbi:MAG TPA: hypothetical protein VM557_05785 [Thermoanaerobaculia bacterium]|nr:hypothetical protein [Thermoanaerobaculia bacterium]
MTGLLSWLVSGLLAAVVASRIRRRSKDWRIEGVVAVMAALVAGLAATAMDFGGLEVLDFRAVMFSFLVAAAAIAGVRLGLPRRPMRDSTR